MRRRRLSPHRPVKRTTWHTRWGIRLVALVAMPFAFVAWTVIGLVSMRELGAVLRQAGEKLEEYDW